jgi:outer membrane protein OmpA-like peptidoglycan-associated protein
MRWPRAAIFCHKTSSHWRFCITPGAAGGVEVVAVTEAEGFRSGRYQLKRSQTMNVLRSGLRAGALGVALVACGATLPVQAGAGALPGEGSKQANVGIVTGLVIGAAAGGPVGAIVGAAAGAVLGDHYHRQQQTAAALGAELSKSEAERARLTHSVSELDSSLSRVQSHDAQLGETVVQTDELGLDVGFRTNDDAVPAQTMSPLLKLGALAATLPQSVVHVAGYADPRGSDAYNDELSLRRAQGVAAVLTSAGLPTERIVLEAHGKTESQSADGDLDAYAFDRRVTVRLQQPVAAQVASRE